MNEATCLRQYADRRADHLGPRCKAGARQIRRLIDKTSGVVSFGAAFIIDLHSHWPLFTRENYICHDGPPYDFEAVMMREFRRGQGKAHSGHDHGPWTHGRRHAGARAVRPARRNRSGQAHAGRPPAEDFARYPRGLARRQRRRRARRLEPRFLRTRAVQTRRKQIEEGLVTADEISEATRTLVRATEAVSAYVLFAGGRVNGLVPVAQSINSNIWANRRYSRAIRATPLLGRVQPGTGYYAADVEDALIGGRGLNLVKYRHAFQGPWSRSRRSSLGARPPAPSDRQTA